MTIATRLSYLLIISIAIMSAMVGISQYDRNQILYIADQASIVDNMAVFSYKLHREERDFFLNLNIDHAKHHEELYQNLLSLMNKVDADVLGDIQPFKTALNAYRDSFQRAVDQQVKIGLTPTSGYYGTLRASVHAIEQDLKSLNQVELTAQMLMLRRHEKDFMLRKDTEYKDKFSKSITAFTESVNKSNLPTEIINKLSQLTTTYNADFMALVAAEATIGIKNHAGLRDNMHTNGIDMENQLKQFYVNAVTQEASMQQRTNIIAMILFAFSISIVLFILLQTRKQILTPLNMIISDITKMATNVSLKEPIRYQNKDEIGDMTAVLNTLLSSLDKGISEANNVVSHIAHANFNQRMVGDYRGDLLTLKEGINASAVSVAFMMDELSKIMKGLHDGQLDLKMNERVPQAFRAQVNDALGNIHGILTNINQVMDRMQGGTFTDRVTANARGDLAEMKAFVNASMEMIDLAISEISRIIVAQSEGDLSIRIHHQFHGQLHVLSEAIDRSASRLEQIVCNAVGTADLVNHSAFQVSDQASKLTSSFDSQVSAIEKATLTMNDISRQAAANNENANEAAGLTSTVQGQASNGVNVMQKTIAAMQTIRDSSHMISDIVTLIDTIAFQTNLLALNAAVEAARAGEHGRGFAVVAGEVRALAGKSAAAAKDIRNLIARSVSEIEGATQLAEESGVVLNDIKQSVHAVATMVQSIATASHEQQNGIRNVHHLVNTIQDITHNNASLVIETAQTAELLTNQASALHENMAFFKRRK
jgi:methyl-accepting chemotaxis protein